MKAKVTRKVVDRERDFGNLCDSEFMDAPLERFYPHTHIQRRERERVESGHKFVNDQN